MTIPDSLGYISDYWLQNDEKRETVAKAGQKLVKEKYQFIPRLQKIIDDSGVKAMEEYLAK